MDAADAARLTEAVTDAVADAVKRGESYSSLENFLTDESVERMTEAVIEEAAETLGLADADDTGVNEKKLGDSRRACPAEAGKRSSGCFCRYVHRGNRSPFGRNENTLQGLH